MPILCFCGSLCQINVLDDVNTWCSISFVHVVMVAKYMQNILGISVHQMTPEQCFSTRAIILCFVGDFFFFFFNYELRHLFLVLVRSSTEITVYNGLL